MIEAPLKKKNVYQNYRWVNKLGGKCPINIPKYLPILGWITSNAILRVLCPSSSSQSSYYILFLSTHVILARYNDGS